MNTQSEGARQTQVVDQMNRLDGAISNANREIENLRGRLQSCSRSETTCVESPPEKSQELVPFAKSISDSALRVERITGQLQDVMAALEI